MALERQTHRVACAARFQGGGSGTNLRGRVTDLSATGLFLETDHLLPVGKSIHLEFELTAGKVEAVGEVRWVARGGGVPIPGMGIRFVRMSAAAARAISESTGPG